MSEQNEGTGGEHYGLLPSLSSKLLLLTFLWVSFIIAMLAYTMMLTWEFERATELGTAVTELRAQTYRSDLMSNPSEKCRIYLKDSPSGISRARLDISHVDYLIEEEGVH